MPTDIDLMEVARCLDDCLVLMMPEEFTEEVGIAAFERVMKHGGRLNYVATMADNLRVAHRQEGEQDA